MGQETTQGKKEKEESTGLHLALECLLCPEPMLPHRYARWQFQLLRLLLSVCLSGKQLNHQFF